MRTRLGIKVATLIGVVGMLGSVGVMTASPASAHPTCPSGYHCVFKDNLGDNQRHNYFNSDNDFGNDRFTNNGGVVDFNVTAASNSSTGGYESHYYLLPGYRDFLFCVNPGHATPNHLPSSLNDLPGSLQLRGTTSIRCY
ncbi:hypothetical protein [Streptomyces sp. AN091965]|uniref:hypothetical protein n=1 Tax=Streptomyces sp. AN091965 TaxID=2927803 RepID=UPI001F613554|nr:hypothetical protein [Streptomyces sp. AN091965]MCI3928567.1 hypothetical protein [Streptomyces sp. AN091965]